LAWVGAIGGPQETELRILSQRACQIVPQAAKDKLDLPAGFFRKCRGELRPGDPMAAQSGTDAAQQPRRDVGAAIGTSATHRPEQPDRQPPKSLLDPA